MEKEYEDHKKEAVGIGVTLSTQLIASSLTMITVAAAIIVFVVEKREVGIFFYVVAFIAFASFVYSIYQGGKGINVIRENGFEGKWSLTTSKSFFNKQAISSLLGIVVLVTTVFFGSEKNEGLSNDMKALIKVVEYRDALSVYKQDVLKKQIDSLKKELVEVSKKTDLIK